MAHSSKEYMRAYMRDYRKEKKAKEEKEEKRRKLKVIGGLLVDWYVWVGQREEYVTAKPKVRKYPQYLKHNYATLPAEVKTPVVDQTGNQIGVKTEKTTVKLTTTDETPSGYARIEESVPSDWRSTVDRVRENAAVQGITVNDIYIKRDIENRLADSITELQGEAFQWKMHAVFERFRKTGNKKFREEWLALLKLQRESEESLDDVIIRGLMKNKSYKQILRDAYCDEGASAFFTRHLAGEFAAKKVIEEIRRDLPFSTKMKREEKKKETYRVIVED